MIYILLHGLGQTSFSWNDTIQTIDEDWDILCPDLSDWLYGEKPCYNTLYKAFEKYCEQFDDMLCLVGLSLGGVLSMQYSIEHPEKVKSLVLIGTQYAMPKGLLKLQNAVFHMLPDSAFSKMGFQKSDFISLCKSMMDLDFSQHLKNIRCKVLVVCGEKDKANKSASAQLVKRLPNAESITISGAGHEVNTDCPVQLGAALKEFFQKADKCSFEVSKVMVEFGTERDIDDWINLVNKVKGNFPGLESQEALDEHRNTVLEFMDKKSAICAKTNNRIVGTLLFSKENNMLCFLAVDTEYRRQHIAEKMVSYMLTFIDSEKDIVVTTYRAGVPEGIAARAFYKKMGFVEGKVTEEFGSPVQEFVLKRRNHNPKWVTNITNN